MKQSFLSNDRIYLRAVEPEDMDVMYEMENDPSMWDISNFTVPYSRYVLRQYIEGSQCDVFADKQLRLMIMSKSDHRILGTIDITDFVPLHSRGEVGIAVHKDYRRQGYASDALQSPCLTPKDTPVRAATPPKLLLTSFNSNSIQFPPILVFLLVVCVCTLQSVLLILVILEYKELF